MQVTRLGEALELHTVARPEPGPGEALLRVHACGINFADTLMAAGRYQERPALPFTPGMEVCGSVVALAPGVSGPPAGTRVACHCGQGGLAEYLTVPASRCVPVPDAMPDAAAAGFLVAYSTSHVALAHRARLLPGETLLVLGASGGVGLTAVEIGRAMGARVIAVARGTEKRAAAAAAGADHVFDADADFRAEVRALGGADVLYDPVGGEAFEAGLRACRPLARILPIGFASGSIPQIPANIVLVKNLTVLGLYWGALADLQPQVLRDSVATLLAWVAQGRLEPHVSHVLDLEQAEAALELLRSRRATGKVVVRVASGA